MPWEIEYTVEFGAWWAGLTESEQEDVAAAVGLLEQHGPHLGHPWSSDVRGSRHRRMRELRIQHRGHPWRVLYAFDPRRMGILLIGGDKAGDDRWYERNVPGADRLYDVHLTQLAEEDRTDGT